MNPQKLESAIMNHFAHVRGSFPEYKVCCEACADSRYRLGINVEKMTGHCFNCGETFNGKKLRELLDIDSMKFYETNDFNSLDKLLQSHVSETKCLSYPQTIHIEAVPMSWIPDSEYYEMFYKIYSLAHQYLADRGFDPVELANSCGLLLPLPDTREEGRLILPIFENGEMVYYQARTLMGQTPKYINPSRLQSEFGKADFVFNLDGVKNKKEIVLCEGIFSALAVGENAVAIMGKELSTQQAFKILRSNVESVTVMFDPGAEKNAIDSAKKLADRIKVKIAYLKNGDPNEVEKSEILKCLEEAKEFDNFLI